jgi:cyanophycinase
MMEIERTLIAGRPPLYVQIPTAATQEGSDRLRYWIDLGHAQAERLGVTARTLVITNRDEANDPENVAMLEGTGLIYLSGGDPKHLTETLADTEVERGIRNAWQSGSSLAGCSAGAMALGEWVVGFRRIPPHPYPGLGIVPKISVLPHFDRTLGRLPDFLSSRTFRPPQGVHLIGIDEETAIVGRAGHFEVMGKRSAWLIGEGTMQRFEPGSTVVLPAALSQDA